MKQIRIFEGTVESALKDCLTAGFFPADLGTVWKLRESGKIENKWYDTSTAFIKGEIRKATLKELKNIKDFYEKGGRVLFLGSNSNIGLNRNFNLNFIGRFVGVKK